MQNHFENVIDEVKSCQPNQRADRLIDGIAHELQNTGSQQSKELGAELERVKPQLVQAFQQPQGQRQT